MRRRCRDRPRAMPARISVSSAPPHCRGLSDIGLEATAVPVQDPLVLLRSFTLVALISSAAVLESCKNRGDCSGDADCSPGAICHRTGAGNGVAGGGTCVPGCRLDTECNTNFTCDNAVCVPVNTRDAAVTTDAGSFTDATPSMDAGFFADAGGMDALVGGDAAASPDATGGADGGGNDAGATADASGHPDAGAPDTGTAGSFNPARIYYGGAENSVLGVADVVAPTLARSFAFPTLTAVMSSLTVLPDGRMIYRNVTGPDGTGEIRIFVPDSVSAATPLDNDPVLATPGCVYVAAFFASPDDGHVIYRCLTDRYAWFDESGGAFGTNGRELVALGHGSLALTGFWQTNLLAVKTSSTTFIPITGLPANRTLWAARATALGFAVVVSPGELYHVDATGTATLAGTYGALPAPLAQLPDMGIGDAVIDTDESLVSVASNDAPTSHPSDVIVRRWLNGTSMILVTSAGPLVPSPYHSLVTSTGL